MYMQCTYRWNGLASLWGFFEGMGLSPAMAEALAPQLAGPAGLLGCARGAVLQALQARLGRDQALGFDTAPEMVLQARSRGCANVHLVSNEQPVPAGLRFRTLIIATGVLDPLETHEAGALLGLLRDHLLPDGELWVLGWGRLGPHWVAARILGAGERLGIANRRLYELHARVGGSSVPAVLHELALSGRDALIARLWLMAIERLVAAVARAEACTREAAAALLKGLAPEVQRRFHPAELADAARLAGLHPVRLHACEGPGVLRLVCRPRTPASQHNSHHFGMGRLP